MTHRTLNIYIYDTQHLKDDGFTERPPSANSSWDSTIQSIFSSKQFLPTGLTRAAFGVFIFTVLAMSSRPGKVIIILANCQRDLVTLSDFNKTRSPIALFLVQLFHLRLMVRSSRYSWTHSFQNICGAACTTSHFLRKFMF